MIYVNHLTKFAHGFQFANSKQSPKGCNHMHYI